MGIGDRVGVSGAADLPAGIDPGALVRRYEPVLRYTEGELFFPTSVDAYIEGAALWERIAGQPNPVLVADHGAVDVARLCNEARARNVGSRLELRYVAGPLSRRELRIWRQDPDRPRFRSSSRFAAVGLLGRLIDSLFRLSLIARGAVPGGLTAAVHRDYSRSAAATAPVYYAHISTDNGYVVVQYWFFYAMNDWRSTFGGVNDHEADWEQVTIYLVPVEGAGAAQRTDGADVLRIGWVAFSSHDETGDDLRRRDDDPDISWVDHTHPVVNAGAGSHSGAYLAGEYLVRVEPPALHRLQAVAARTREIVLPWTRNRPRTGLGIPYIDYKRGDGMQIGPGTDRPWSPVLIDSQTPWVRDFRGLWGLDTEDPFGGERAPAGPRYERNGTIRPSWSDPVGWAGLSKVPSTSEGHREAVASRLVALSIREVALTGDIAEQVRVLQQLNTGASALPPAMAANRRGGIGANARLLEQERVLAELRAARRAAVTEREHLTAAQTDPPERGPHAHLRHRALPDTDSERPPGLLLRFWTEVSLSVLLALLGGSLLFDYSSIWWATISAIFVVSAVEAVLRRRLPIFLLGVAVAAAIGGVTILLVTNVRAGLGVLSLTAAFVILIANVRAYFARR